MSKEGINHNNGKNKIEIDYDKLEVAITSAIEKSNKNHNKQSVRIKIINFLNGALYIGICSVLVCIIVAMWQGEILAMNTTVENILFSGIFAIMAVGMFLAQQESLSDRPDEVIKYFNINLTVIAVLITIYTLVASGEIL